LIQEIQCAGVKWRFAASSIQKLGHKKKRQFLVSVVWCRFLKRLGCHHAQSIDGARAANPASSTINQEAAP